MQAIHRTLFENLEKSLEATFKVGKKREHGFRYKKDENMTMPQFCNHVLGAKISPDQAVGIRLLVAYSPCLG